MLDTFQGFVSAVVEVLCDQDELAALELLGMSAEAGVVTLLEGETTAAEALAYARMMYDIGWDHVGDDVLKAVLRARVEPVAMPAQPGQIMTWAAPLGDQ